MHVDAYLVHRLPGLAVAAFVAGCVDAMVGGGGLVQLPAMLLLLPSVALPAILGTNKFSSIFGTASAAVNYAKTETFDWRIFGPAVLCAFVGAFFGARATSLLHPQVFRPLIMVLLIVLAIITAARPQLGTVAELHTPRSRHPWATACLIAGPIGIYDGFFGPGTGTLLVFAFVWTLGWTFIRASAISKVLNAATNLSALIYFIHGHDILFAIGIPMAVANVAGSYCGVRLAVEKGNSFVRWAFLTIVFCLVLKLGYDTLVSGIR